MAGKTGVLWLTEISAAIGAMADRVIYRRSGRIDRMVINDSPLEAEGVSW